MTARRHVLLAVNTGLFRSGCVILAILPLLLAGCFSERSFPMNPRRLVRLQPEQVAHAGARLPARQWAPVAHAAAAHLLPHFDRAPLTTDSLGTDVYQYFDIDPTGLDDLFGNFDGLEQTAEVSSPPPVFDDRRHIQRSAWRGFVDVQVPASDGAVLFGRLGAPERANEIPGSYIVVTHGLFGTLDGLDMENHVQALRRAGHHVLAIEMRGHGETACAHPEYIVSFGVQESTDLLEVAQWLKSTQHARRVGLVSFSITGYEALLAAWLDGAAAPPQFERLPVPARPRPGAEPAYNAGMFIVSAPVDLLATADEFNTHYELLDAPLKSTIEGRVARRIEEESGSAGKAESGGYSMWDYIHNEFDRSGWERNYGSYESFRLEFRHFVDLHAGDWSEGVRRMEAIRAPVLILTAANDPLGTAQHVADLFSRVKNPNIGVIMLPAGGHMGFSALSADYYYSMMTNFFDPATAPLAVSSSAAIAAAQQSVKPTASP